MGHLPPAEADSDLHPVPVGEKTLGVADLDIEIIDVDPRGHPNLFDLHDPLILFCFLVPLGLLEPVLAVIHELADRGDRVGGDLDQVQISLGGLGHGLVDGQDAQLFSRGGNQANFLVSDLLVDLMSRMRDDERTS